MCVCTLLSKGGAQLATSNWARLNSHCVVRNGAHNRVFNARSTWQSDSNNCSSLGWQGQGYAENLHYCLIAPRATMAGDHVVVVRTKRHYAHVQRRHGNCLLASKRLEMGREAVTAGGNSWMGSALSPANAWSCCDASSNALLKCLSAVGCKGQLKM